MRCSRWFVLISKSFFFKIIINCTDRRVVCDDEIGPKLKKKNETFVHVLIKEMCFSLEQSYANIWCNYYYYRNKNWMKFHPKK